MEKIVKMYDGYRFEETVAHVFNPVSVGKCLSSGKFGEYWFETGTPTFLLQLFSEAPEQVDGVTLDASAFSVYEPSAPEMLPLAGVAFDAEMRNLSGRKIEVRS